MLETKAKEKELHEKKTTRCRRCLGVVLDNIPLGSIKLALFDFDADRKFNSHMSRTFGRFFTSVFLLQVFFIVSSFGQVSS